MPGSFLKVNSRTKAGLRVVKELLEDNKLVSILVLLLRHSPKRKLPRFENSRNVEMRELSICLPALPNNFQGNSQSFSNSHASEPRAPTRFGICYLWPLSFTPLYRAEVSPVNSCASRKGFLGPAVAPLRRDSSPALSSSNGFKSSRFNLFQTEIDINPFKGPAAAGTLSRFENSQNIKGPPSTCQLSIQASHRSPSILSRFSVRSSSTLCGS
jgi:hypothetical protein